MIQTLENKGLSVIIVTLFIEAKMRREVVEQLDGIDIVILMRLDGVLSDWRG